MRRAPWVALAVVLAALWSVHLAATAAHGFALPDATRAAVGASASTVGSRLHAQFTAPLFHEHLFHLAYNSALFALGLPVAVRAFGLRALPAAYLASPLVGVAIDVLLILPLAAAGSATAREAAPERLVGASVVAFASLGMALGAMRPRLGRWTAGIGVAVVVYEAALALTGTTQGFVWAYHLGGFALGLTTAALFARARRARASGDASSG